MHPMPISVVAWMLLWRAVVATSRLKELLDDAEEDAKREKIGKNRTVAYYEGQLKSAEYFIHTVLPVIRGKLDSIATCNNAIVEIPTIAFGG